MVASRITADGPRGGESPSLVGIFPLMIIYAVGFMSATYLPVWVSAASSRYGVPASDVGLIGSFELGAIAVATILSAAFGSPGTTRMPLAIGLAASIGFNVLTAMADSIGLFTVALIIAGIANGFLLAEVNGRAAVSGAPTRVFTGQLFVMMGCAVVFFAAAPRLLSSWGGGAPFLFCAGAGAVALISLWKLQPRAAQTGAGPVHHEFRMQAAGVLLLIAPTLLFISMNIIWPFIGAEASRAGVSLATYSKALSVGAFVNLAGPVLAERLLRRRSSWILAMSLGITALLVCAALITAFPGAGAFMTGVIFLPFFLLVLVPFYLSLLLKSDPSGKLVSVSSAFFMIGTAVGPGLGGLALDALGLPGLAFASILTPLLALLATLAGALGCSRRARVTLGNPS